LKQNASNLGKPSLGRILGNDKQMPLQRANRGDSLVRDLISRTKCEKVHTCKRQFPLTAPAGA
jgi:hypothetical protein